MPHALLRLRQQERDRLLRRIRQGLEADPRVSAAWLEGSCGRGDHDALSDLDLAVVVSDSAMAAVAGGPARPLSYPNVAGSARARWVAQFAEPLLLLEAPQNARPGGAFLTTFFRGEAGPQQVDWQWLPRSTARRPRDSLLLFDRVGVPHESATVEDGPPGAAPHRTPFEVAAHAVPWFWATLLWNAKHAARATNNSPLPMLAQTLGAIDDVERFVDPGAARSAAEPPADGLRILFGLTERMERLMAQAPVLTAEIPPAVAPQFRSYLDLAERVIRG